jgi:biopolymer transport protein ExbD
MDRKLGGSGGVRSEINVTPLVDVCLVLLIIFMVVTPLLDAGRAELPETSQPESMAQGAHQLEISIRRDGKVFVADQWVSADHLRGSLAAAHQGRPAAEVVVKADARLRYATVRHLLRDLEQAGFSGAGLATRKKAEVR